MQEKCLSMQPLLVTFGKVPIMTMGVALATVENTTD
jgi:hypothetical protein